ncbi:hypothetical protein PPERSA_12448 [Pseudocohnilembus persalinus]|uniref:Uncharacterized protein n=1 Tax=Pseudocohnilembus persalinus TaxID=266149 RepID=A0A0V0QPE5_PSEPJ|nr:hypothetical protein PPERSA_12448 [Pseudocohnilembus persalinus]|eukprot:KRX04001.1 hypothetical protein PPERSA_12448 [Pseudocohnilembus persalinus]
MASTFNLVRTSDLMQNLIPGSLLVLSFEQTNIDSEALTQLVPALGNLTNLKSLNLKNNQLSDQIFEIIILFPLPFHLEIMTQGIDLFKKMVNFGEDYILENHIKELNQKICDSLQIQYNLDKYDQKETDSYVQRQYKQSINNQLKIYDNQSHEIDYNQFNSNNKNSNKHSGNVTLTIRRISYTNGQKAPPNKKKFIIAMTQLRAKITELLNQNPTVEEIKDLCQEIQDQQYEFPLKLLEELSEFIWNKLNEAVLIRDHYSISYLGDCCEIIGLDVQYFKDKFQKVDQRLKNIIQRVEKLFNLDEDQLKENDFNKELDELVKETLRLDLRGYPIDMLFMIKEKRDEYIIKYIDQNINWENQKLQQVLRIELNKESEYYLNEESENNLQLLFNELNNIFYLQLIEENSLFQQPYKSIKLVNIQGQYQIKSLPNNVQYPVKNKENLLQSSQNDKNLYTSSQNNNTNTTIQQNVADHKNIKMNEISTIEPIQKNNKQNDINIYNQDSQSLNSKIQQALFNFPGSKNQNILQQQQTINFEQQNEQNMVDDQNQEQNQNKQNDNLNNKNLSTLQHKITNKVDNITNQKQGDLNSKLQQALLNFPGTKKANQNINIDNKPAEFKNQNETEQQNQIDQNLDYNTKLQQALFNFPGPKPQINQTQQNNQNTNQGQQVNLQNQNSIQNYNLNLSKDNNSLLQQHQTPQFIQTDSVNLNEFQQIQQQQSDPNQLSSDDIKKICNKTIKKFRKQKKIGDQSSQSITNFMENIRLKIQKAMMKLHKKTRQNKNLYNNKDKDKNKSIGIEINENNLRHPNYRILNQYSFIMQQKGYPVNPSQKGTRLFVLANVIFFILYKLQKISDQQIRERFAFNSNPNISQFSKENFLQNFLFSIVHRNLENLRCSGIILALQTYFCLKFPQNLSQYNFISMPIWFLVLAKSLFNFYKSTQEQQNEYKYYQSLGPVVSGILYFLIEKLVSKDNKYQLTQHHFNKIQIN